MPDSLNDDKNRKAFVAALLRWFAGAMRPLPWRENYEPYAVWISEIMLQQTQMERGVRYFTEWMRRFPDVQSVARAEPDAVLAAWEGLGYYSRARNLHAAAREIMTRHDGVFPDDPESIRALPGVGEYTAAAIASIAFGHPIPAVDANVLRIFARLLDIEKPVTGSEARSAVTEAVRRLMPFAKARELNQALMEFGALVCGKTPGCANCPVTRFCAAHRNGTENSRPVKGAKTEYRNIELVAAVIMSGEKTYIRKRPEGRLWPGLWELPSADVGPGEAPETALSRHLTRALPFPVTIIRHIGTVRHGYTTNRVTLHGYMCEADEAVPAESERWLFPSEFSEYSFAAGHRKLLEKLGWKQSPAK